jgi:hypothetical protein
MAALKTLGDLLDGSGWTTILVNANVTSARRADAMVHASLYVALDMLAGQFLPVVPLGLAEGWQ